MKNNTIVTASDMNYLWGVFLLAASVRKNGMDEPILVFGDRYTQRAKDILAQFGDVRVADAPVSNRSMTCRKPEAMLLADTEFITWADSDGFFVNNCSAQLLPPNPAQIRIRRRSEAEVEGTKLAARDASGKIVIAPFMSDVWRRDVAELDKPRLSTCCSACILSVSAEQRPFLERWRDNMAKFLHDGDVGVVDTRSPAYFQTDESVLNSLLCYMRDAPVPTEAFGLNRAESLFVHFISQPKPWVAWTPKSLKRMREYLATVDYVLKRGYELPTPLPFALNAKYASIFPLIAPLVVLRRKLKSARAKFGL